jgi:hypothetical protein
LSNHPVVCASSIKETQFFHDWVTADEALTYENYRRFFSDCGAETSVAVEASPSYFTSGLRLAERIASVLPDVKLIVMLRDPVDRLYSYFKSAQNYDNYATPMLEGYTFGEFVEEAIATVRELSSGDEKKTEFRRALEQGAYMSHAREFHAIFPHARIRYVFLEEFRKDPRRCMQDLCDFVGLTPCFYNNYNFSVENKSRNYRIRLLQRVAFQANRRLEGFLNRTPGLRRRLRSGYLMLNEDRSSAEAKIDTTSREMLGDFYRESNSNFRDFLVEHYPRLRLPSWLQATDGSVV